MKEGMEYVGRRARELGLELKIAMHSRLTESVQEKAVLLGWPVRRVVKTVYASNGRDMVGFVAPGSYDQIPIRDVLKEQLGIGTRAAKRYSLSQPPSTMRYGTCTPFAQEWLVGKQISRLFLADEPDLCTTVVDVALGGTEEDDLCRSAQLPYGGIRDILHKEFGSWVGTFCQAYSLSARC